MMTNVLTYLLYVALSLTGFYAVYYLLLRRSTLFGFNRTYLIGSFIFSFLLPFINVPWLAIQPAESQAPAFELPILPKTESLTPEVAEPALWETLLQMVPQISLWIYLTGLAILVIRLGIGLWRMYRLKISARREIVANHAVYRSPRIHSPASFMQIIFIPEHIEPGAIEAVLRHEQAHVRQLHTIDVLLVEIGLALQWFNPFVWAYRNSVREVHEYLADEASISFNRTPESAMARIHYQKALLAFSSKAASRHLIHTFSQPTLKNRIIMMNKRRNKPLSALKAAVAVPMALALLVLWADQADAQVSEKPTTELTAASDTIYVVDGKVYSSVDHIDPDDIKSINVTNSIETVTAYGGSAGQKVIEIILKDDKEEYLTDAEREEMKVVVSPTEGSQEEVEEMFEGTKIVKTGDNYPPPLYIINGEEVESFRTVNPDDILTMDVMKGKEATEKYGEKGKNGVVKIVVRERVKIKKEQKNELTPKSDQGQNPDPDPNPDVDSDDIDFDIDEDVDMDEDVNVDEDIDSDADEDADLEGVVKVRKTDVESRGSEGQPLFVINGKIYDSSEDKTALPLERDKITDITVLKGEKAYEKYGKRGALNGVVEITTREK
ncbi:M56 family metallopeptidase [Roseivirga sp. BDSF3-8]|uniref:M56 family metallopeptidase n=1 Tax=Roseivirga sp. BDSF3-8 TaxID=3241598 RepID=UPI003531D0D2